MTIGYLKRILPIYLEAKMNVLSIQPVTQGRNQQAKYQMTQEILEEFVTWLERREK